MAGVGGGGFWVGFKKVDKKECKERMEAHHAFCPENRKVLTKADHTELCDLKLKPIHESMERIEKTVAIVPAMKSTMDELLIEMRKG